VDIQNRKLRLIEDFLKIRDKSMLDKIEALLKSQSINKKQPDIEKFSGIWTKKEAEEVSKIIEEGCEQINNEDW